MTEPPLVEIAGVSKEFLGFKALTNVDFCLKRGEVHVLFGENGAGKSTLISILSGVYRPTSGLIRIEGKEVEFHSVHDAREAGIGTVFQEFSLVPTLRVFENVYLGKEPRARVLVDRKRMLEGAKRLFEELQFDIDVRLPISRLSRAQQQMVEIAKAFQSNARVLILDEPTASLTEKETEKLFAFVRRAKENGVGIIYISHRMQEFASIADRVTVLRDGKLVGTVSARNISESTLVEMMVGRAIEKVYPHIARQPKRESLLSLRGIRAAGVNGVDLEVKAGEVLGIAGLVGSGKSRVWRTILGLQPMLAGSVTLQGRDVTGRSTQHLLQSGLFYLPPDRKAEGLILSSSARDNIRLGLLQRRDLVGLFGLQSAARANAEADRVASKVEIAPGALTKPVSTLSGGNQQKVLFGKGICENRLVYIFDEPTVGVDVGTRSQLYLHIRDLAEAGKAVVVISSDLPEVLHLSHRLLVFANGRIAAELEEDEKSEEVVLRNFFAVKRSELNECA